MKFQWDTFFMVDEPMILGALISIVVGFIAVVAGLTYFKKWTWLWKEYLTTVDHKKIGVMYILCAVLMLFRGGIDALLMRIQLTLPNLKFLDAEHYNQIFTTHGVIMILFMAMPFLMGLINLVMPLQIGARDVAFPYLNALSFWLFFMGFGLFNLSFVIGGSPDAGWTAYFPYAGTEFTHGPGNNYYAVALQIAGIGTLASAINFLVTIFKMRAPGMTLMKMPMFTWSIVAMSVIIIAAFPVLTVGLALMTFDRLFDAHFFTMSNGGMPMLWANIFWIWGHPEVYIVVLPAFGIFSDIITTFSKKRLFGYGSMVLSMMAIAAMSYLTWVHHFFTMGAGPAVNSFFSVTTMAIAIPTGIKIFNWLATMYKGKLQFTTPMLWTVGFIPNFIVGGATGVLLAMASADYQYHNSYYLVAHFHHVLIAGVVFACFGGLHFWYPKMFGHMLNETLGKWTFWVFVIGFNICFYPMYFLGLKGMTRRMVTYQADLGWTGLNVVATIGAFLMGIAFLILCYNIYYSARYGKRDTTGDPWGGRTLEWATATPVPHYNFAKVPVVQEVDEFHRMKQNGESWKIKEEEIEPIHMPNSSGRPFWMSIAFFVAGFGLVFQWYWMAIAGFVFILAALALRSLEKDEGYYVSTDEIKETEGFTRGEK